MKERHLSGKSRGKHENLLEKLPPNSGLETALSRSPHLPLLLCCHSRLDTRLHSQCHALPCRNPCLRPVTLCSAPIAVIAYHSLPCKRGICLEKGEEKEGGSSKRAQEFRMWACMCSERSSLHGEMAGASYSESGENIEGASTTEFVEDSLNWRPQTSTVRVTSTLTTRSRTYLSLAQAAARGAKFVDTSARHYGDGRACTITR